MSRALKAVGVAAALVDAATVHTSFGPLRGRTLSNGAEQYMGVPFATAMRFGDPVDWNTSWDTPRDALQKAGTCQGDVGAPGQEDCLYLNVWRYPGKENQPVLFFLHGGSFIAEDATDYNCSSNAAKHKAIYVTSNYRLASLGFLTVSDCSTEANCQANFGLKDQLSALRWVSREIGAFGGNASQVMLWGQSAGAMSVVYHLVSPSSVGLFARAFVESFVGMAYGMDPLVAANASRAFASFLGCDMGDLECLRKPTLEHVIEAQEAALDAVCGVCDDDSDCTVVQEFCRQDVFLPTVDGTLLPAFPFQLLQDGQFNRDVDVVIGSNTNEATMSSADVQNYGYSHWEDLVGDYLSLLLSKSQRGPVPSQIVQKVLTRYPADDPNSAFVSDSTYICPSEQVVQLLSTFSNKNVYRYRYDYQRAMHGDELNFVFPDEAYQPYTPAEQAFSDDLGAAWAKFAGSGVPSPSWRRYMNSTDLDIVLVPGLWPVETGWRTESCDFWAHLCDDHSCEPTASNSILV